MTDSSGEVLSVDVVEGSFTGGLMLPPHYTHRARIHMKNGTWSYGFGFDEAKAIEDAERRIESGTVTHTGWDRS